MPATDHAILLAAGQGTRLWPLTATRPKPLIPIAGEPLVCRLARQLSEAGITQLQAVVSDAKGPVAAALADRCPELGLELEIAVQTERRGTGHALQQADLGDQATVVAYGDLFLPDGAIAELVDQPTTGVIGARTVDDPSRYGALDTDDGELVRIVEKSPDPPSDEVNAGVYRLPPGFHNHLEELEPSPRGELELTDAINAATRAGAGFTVHTFEAWVDVGWPWDILEANTLALSTLETRIDGTVEDGVVIEGPAVIHETAHVKAGTRIEGPVIVGPGSTVGPNAYLRPSTTLGEGCKVGNGCEVKNSVLFDGAKVPHLSYVGDSVLGQEVNLGAGTQVANLRHDGATLRVRTKRGRIDSGRRKLGVILGDGVKTGINATLNCGVMLGPGELVAPGEVVERSRVPEG